MAPHRSPAAHRLLDELINREVVDEAEIAGMTVRKLKYLYKQHQRRTEAQNEASQLKESSNQYKKESVRTNQQQCQDKFSNKKMVGVKREGKANGSPDGNKDRLKRIRNDDGDGKSADSTTNQQQSDANARPDPFATNANENACNSLGVISSNLSNDNKITGTTTNITGNLNVVNVINVVNATATTETEISQPDAADTIQPAKIVVADPVAVVAVVADAEVADPVVAVPVADVPVANVPVAAAPVADVPVAAAPV